MAEVKIGDDSRAGLLGDGDSIADMVAVAVGQRDMGDACRGRFDVNALCAGISGEERIDQDDGLFLFPRGMPNVQAMSVSSRYPLRNWQRLPCMPFACQMITVEDLSAQIKPGKPLAGLDLGTKTIGFAVSDIGWRLANPKLVIQRTQIHQGCAGAAPPACSVR